MGMPQVTALSGYKTLLVPTDFSARSQAALVCAAAIARTSGARVVIAHVITPEHWHLVPPQEMHPALSHDRRVTEKKMACILKSDRLRGLRTETVIKEGDFRRVLCTVAGEQHVDLLVVGTHGRKGLSKLLFGSKVEEVCNRAPCPILLVGPKVKVQQGRGFERVLFTTDLSPLSLSALPAVLAFASQHGSRLKIAHVVGEESTGASAKSEFGLARMKGELAPALSVRTALAHEPEYSVGYGPAKETTLRIAEEWGADVIGMGAHRPGALGVYLPGDLAYQVASEAQCPVLTVID